MSSITSQSELTTKEIVEQAISDYHDSILPYLGYRPLITGGDTPIGQINFFDDVEAPENWLICDGTVYNITDYPFLANHIESVHGSKNFYGGDGTTTFAVPDLQGEFLRGAGTNGHTNQGNGGSVGEHQDGTEHITVFKNGQGQIGVSASLGNWYDGKNKDSFKFSNNYMAQTNASYFNQENYYSEYTSRPTNTSFLICIKATPAGINYSTDEQVVGTWIDGKPLYSKVVDFGTIHSGAGTSTLSSNISNVEHWHIISAFASNGSQLQYMSGTNNYGSNVGYMGYLSNGVPTLSISTSSDRSGFRHIFGILQYTKTSD